MSSWEDLNIITTCTDRPYRVSTCLLRTETGHWTYRTVVWDMMYGRAQSTVNKDNQRAAIAVHWAAVDQFEKVKA